MAKKQSIPDTIIKQFNKPQFKPDDAVFFTWLGTKKYGYVTRIKEATWGIQYMVESHNTRYPCGVSIKGHKTAYTTGCINIDETRSIGQDELKRRIQTGHTSTYSELFTDTRRTENESRSESTTSKRIPASNSKRNESTRSNNKTKHVTEPSIDGDSKGIGKKRKNSKLDDAIQRQRDFLNGFVKNSD